MNKLIRCVRLEALESPAGYHQKKAGRIYIIKRIREAERERRKCRRRHGMKQRDINVEKGFYQRNRVFPQKGQVAARRYGRHWACGGYLCGGGGDGHGNYRWKARSTGWVRLCITYISRDGAVCGFASETLFSGAVSSAELSADMEN